MPAITQMKTQIKDACCKVQQLKITTFFKEATLDWRHGPSFMLGMVLNYRECTSQRNGARMHVGAFLLIFLFMPFSSPEAAVLHVGQKMVYTLEKRFARKRGGPFLLLFVRIIQKNPV